MNVRSILSSYWHETGVKEATIAAFFLAWFFTLDNLIINLRIPDDVAPVMGVASYLLAGAWIGLILSPILAHFIGHRIDSRYHGLSWGNQNSQKQALVAGVISAFATYVGLMAHLGNEPSTITALGVVLVVYLVIYDVIKHKMSWWILAPAVIVAYGTFLASAVDASNVFSNLAVIILVSVIAKGISVVSEVAEQEGVKVDGGIDCINYFIWRFFYLTITATAITFLLATARGDTEFFSRTYAFAIGDHFTTLMIIGTMLAVFISTGYKFYAKMVLNVSKVGVFVSSSLIFSFIITLALYQINHEWFPDYPGPDVWLQRIIGSFLIIAGILVLLWLHRRLKPDTKPAT